MSSPSPRLTVDSPLSSWTRPGLDLTGLGELATSAGLEHPWRQALAVDRFAAVLLENWPAGADGVQMRDASLAGPWKKMVFDLEGHWPPHSRILRSFQERFRVNRSLSEAVNDAMSVFRGIEVGPLARLASASGDFHGPAVWAGLPLLARSPPLVAFLAKIRLEGGFAPASPSQPPRSRL